MQVLRFLFYQASISNNEIIPDSFGLDEHDKIFIKSKLEARLFAQVVTLITS